MPWFQPSVATRSPGGCRGRQGLGESAGAAGEVGDGVGGGLPISSATRQTIFLAAAEHRLAAAEDRRQREREIHI